MKKLLLLLVLSTVFFSCEKEGPIGPQGEKGEQGPNAKHYKKTLDFSVGDTIASFGIIPNFEKNDIIVTYAKWDDEGEESTWIQLPLTSTTLNLTILPIFSQSTGELWIEIGKADGSFGSYFTVDRSLAFRAVHIKTSALKEHPNVDLSKYEEVVKTFNIEE